MDERGQIPDMNSFGSLLAGNGYQKLPGGLILQWGSFTVSTTSGGVGTADVTYPIAFPTAYRSIGAIISTNDPSARFIGFDNANTNATKARFTYVTNTSNAIYWKVIGY